METSVGSLLDALRDPQMRHAATVHLPIALSVLGVLPATALLLTRGKNITLRWCTLAAYVLLALAAFAATQSGESAKGEMGKAATEVGKIVHDHEEMAEKIWLFALTTAVLTGAGWVHRLRVGQVCLPLGLASALFTAGWVAQTAHLGGTLVYDHGVGMPPADLQKLTSTDMVDESSAVDPRIVFFRENIKPVLNQQCFGCHGGGDILGGGLDMTEITGLLKGGYNGPAVVPGIPEESLLIVAVTWQRDDLRMPKNKDQLPAQTIADLKKWIQDGAVWED